MHFPVLNQRKETLDSNIQEAGCSSLSVSGKRSTYRKHGLGRSITGLDMIPRANHNSKLFQDIKSVFSPVHFLSCRLLSKLLTVWVRDHWLHFPDLSVTLREAPSEETLDATELEMECREQHYGYRAPVWAVKKNPQPSFCTLKTPTNQASRNLQAMLLLRQP